MRAGRFHGSGPWRLGDPGASPAELGGKAHTLGVLRADGYPVPEGFCIPASMLEPLAARHAEPIARALAASPPVDPASARRAARAVGAITARATLPEAIAAPVLLAYRALGADAEVAVRSSAPHEDGARASFAGQYATSLGVVGEPALRAAVVTGWASLYSASALLYRRRFGVTGSPRMALLVQRQLAFDVAGVLFSVDPLDPESDSMRLEAARGSGAALVAGGGADATWLLARRGHRPWHCTSGDASLLSPGDLARIRKLALDVELRLGWATDLEWGLRAGLPVLLQARPATASAGAGESQAEASRTASSNRNLGHP